MPLKCRSQKRKHTESCLDPMTGTTATENRSTRVDGSSVNSDLAVPLTKDDIPMIIQEVTRQLRPENNKVCTSPPMSYVPSMFINF